MIVCAGKNETLKGAVPIGIGLVESAINLTKLYYETKPKELIFVGSAGSYGRADIFDTLSSSEAYNIEISYLDNLSYTPISDNILKNVSCETIKVNSSNYITVSKEHAKRFLKMGLDIENMEFFTVVRVARYFGIEAKGEFVVTNYCDENAHKDFIKNHKKAMMIMERIVERYA